MEGVTLKQLETPETTYNLEVADFHTYYVSDACVLVHNAGCGKGINKTEHYANRKDALQRGKGFLGDGYRSVGKGRYISKDGLRTMRFDFTHHGGTRHHINLETWERAVEKGVKNKLVENIHVFWNGLF